MCIKLKRLRPSLQNEKSSSKLVVLAGPTAVGKGTVLNKVHELAPSLWQSVSVTTRPPRPGEVDGKHYHFITDAQFDELIENNELLEWATVHNNYRYGTPAKPVEQELAQGRTVLLEIDLAGARQVKQARPDAVLVFLAPPSFEELVRRSEKRGTETPTEREQRLATAHAEMAAESEFDFTIVNTEITAAAEELLDLLGPTQ